MSLRWSAPPCTNSVSPTTSAREACAAAGSARATATAGAARNLRNSMRSPLLGSMYGRQGRGAATRYSWPDRSRTSSLEVRLVVPGRQHPAGQVHAIHHATGPALEDRDAGVGVAGLKQRQHVGG